MSLSEMATWFLQTPSQQIDAIDATIPVRKIGVGPPVLFLHGWPMTSATFRQVTARLEQHFTSYLPDLPGCGESQWEDKTDFSILGRAKTIATVLDKLDIHRYFMVAQDTGATIGRMLALIQPDRIQKFVIINTEIPLHRPPWIPLYRLLMFLPGSNLLFRQVIRSRRFVRSSLGFGSCFHDARLLEGDFEELVLRPIINSNQRMDGQARALKGIDWSVVDRFAKDHAKITAQVLLIWGEEDQTFPIEIARKIVPQFSNCVGLEAIRKAKLLVHEERPQEVADLILRFFHGSEVTAGR